MSTPQPSDPPPFIAAASGGEEEDALESPIIPRLRAIMIGTTATVVAALVLCDHPLRLVPELYTSPRTAPVAIGIQTAGILFSVALPVLLGARFVPALIESDVITERPDLSQLADDLSARARADGFTVIRAGDEHAVSLTLERGRTWKAFGTLAYNAQHLTIDLLPIRAGIRAKIRQKFSGNARTVVDVGATAEREAFAKTLVTGVPTPRPARVPGFLTMAYWGVAVSSIAVAFARPLGLSLGLAHDMSVGAIKIGATFLVLGWIVAALGKMRANFYVACLAALTGAHIVECLLGRR